MTTPYPPPGSSWPRATPPRGGPVPPSPPGAVPDRPTAGRRWWSRVATVWIVVASFVASTLCIAFAGSAGGMVDGAAPSGGTVLWVALGWMYALGVATLLVFRRRYPVAVCLVACAGALVFPLDAVGALVTLSWVISSRPARQGWILGVLTALATTVALGRDLLRAPEQQIFSFTPTGSQTPVGAAAWVYVVLLVAGLALSVSVGWARRAHYQVGRFRGEVQRHEVVAEHLRDEVARQDAEAERLRDEVTRQQEEVARQQERHLIAREVHDTLAHSLSLVSLHSGVLEVSVPEEDGQLRDAAKVVRENAHRSLEDLRDLIEILRDPDGLAQRQARRAGGTLADLSALLATTRAAGTRLVATVVFDDASSVGPQVARATYRILQESLTNVHKHAPGSEVLIDLGGTPASGVSLRVTNVLPESPGPRAPGSRAGVTGIAERVKLLGGRSTVGPRDGSFVVEVWLPWVSDVVDLGEPPPATAGRRP
ncbi:sensor histidine kinase [Oerskovia paurometabola]|uniref:sensor histidine kinase n=1 Tax=Oerskovia paurometabola TaxID=162170 RepID=UPI003439764B